ncbi:MAG: lipid-A-disaccharide synthase [Gammaproteobacteria bacterium]|nr:lipid-A-disaccharide synthase [Gammaproteobacteria bacterium]MDD9799566.1 lipid-A-disaccharide synthase [Gammaproteobacteria bacterium]MDD9816431.1 lipid-A-disaccharide synthase [Gammaproteobacteria bacterium]MDD9870106.1 lipid-A-disaccharide synthase [Gammaproteobacteria bacterium]
MSRPPQIGIVAGEPSGDILGGGMAGLLREKFPGARLAGIGGPAMRAAGVEILHPMESIMLMGLEGAPRQLLSILRIRRRLKKYFLREKVDLFIGVDVPDFNLTLENTLRRRGVPTVQYVSPAVWAWRGYRIRKIRRGVSHMLALFPFEADYFEARGIAATFVGHPLAREVSAMADKKTLRAELALPAASTVVALLPGSRASEVTQLSRVMARAAQLLRRELPAVTFVAPMVSAAMRDCFVRCAGDALAGLPLRIVDGRSRQALAAADAALLASGTASLEALLVGTPMVVTYKATPLSAALVRMFSRVRHYAMPNHLLAEPLVPERIQRRATAGELARALGEVLRDDRYREKIRAEFRAVREQLAAAGIERAAPVLAELLAGRG